MPGFNSSGMYSTNSVVSDSYLIHYLLPVASLSSSLFTRHLRIKSNQSRVVPQLPLGTKMISELKICRSCKASKTFAEFKHHKNGHKNGLDNICKQCHREYLRVFRDSPKGRALEFWRQLNARARRSSNFKLSMNKQEWLNYAVAKITVLMNNHPELYVSFSSASHDHIYSPEQITIRSGKPRLQPLSNNNATIEYANVTKLKDPVLEEVRLRHKEELSKLNNSQVNVVEGFVYIITHPLINEVKIGSAIDYEQRLRQYQTGDPFRRYKIEYALYFTEAEKNEKLVHSLLEEFRVKESKEWFNVTVEHAKAVIEGLQQK